MHIGTLKDIYTPTVSIKQYQILLILLVYTVALLMIASSDGWWRFPTLGGDRAWFYMCGKAWMEGLVPYRDFTDSKGPMIWLIYGIGYLISPHNFYGLFLFEIIFYWLTFFVLFKSANLMLNNAPQSILASMLLAIFYFYPGMHAQMRLEDLCHLFQALVFYILIKSLYLGSFKPKYGIWLGICSGCFLLMKYSYFLTLQIPVFILFLYLYIKISHKLSFKFLFIYILGFLSVSLPFFIYLIIIGAFTDFATEYFINTGFTILNVKETLEHESGNLKMRWPLKIWTIHRQFNFFSEFLRLVFVGLCFSCVYFNKKIWMVYALLLWYFGSIFLYSLVDGEAYYLMLSIFVFGALIWAISCLKRLSLEGSIVAGGVFLAFIAVISSHYFFSEFYFIERDRKGQQNLTLVATRINEWEATNNLKPTITYYNTYDHGEDIKTNALPGTKYWAAQAGMTSEMIFHHREDIFTNRPTFIIVKKNDNYINKRLLENNYKLILEYEPVPSLPWQDENIHCLYENIIIPFPLTDCDLRGNK